MGQLENVTGQLHLWLRQRVVIIFLLPTLVLLPLSACMSSAVISSASRSHPTNAPGHRAAVRGAGTNVQPSMRPWRYIGANPDSWWDPTHGQKFIDEEMPLIQDLGVQTLRIEFPWFLLEPFHQGMYDWTRADYILTKAKQSSIHVQPVIIWTPAWASPGCHNPEVSCSTSSGQATCPASAPSQDVFSSFVAALVRHVNSAYPGVVYSWEMWNEPNLPKYFSGSANRYATRVLIPGYNAVKSVDSNAMVILGGPSSPDLGWLQEVVNVGGLHHFDILAFHDYTSAINRHAEKIQEWLNRNGIGKTPIWLGEYGFQENSLQDSNQEGMLRDVLAGASPIAMAQWYTLRDDYAMNRAQICVYAYWGVVKHDDLTRKSGYFTMKRLIRG